ncbi:hypothetical protein LC612_28450 [Nostoc sp. CHAB 5834]|nr:hypothetical protein [Nostoc sp. CHAB 5834]
MTYDDLPEALCKATVKTTASEVREALQAVRNSISPQQISQVWQRLYERIATS